jgi:hypothetical protein
MWRGVPLQTFVDKHNAPFRNFISEGVDQQTLNDLGFDEESHVMHDKFTWANIACEVGLFSSVGNAKKAGWNIPIDEGFSEACFHVKNAPIFVFIFKQS